jgi:hypothetical protein
LPGVNLMFTSSKSVLLPYLKVIFEVPIMELL